MNQKMVGCFLKKLRNEKSMTQEQLAEMLGVSNRSISRWENGVTMPDFDLLIQLAKFYDVEIEEILNGERREEHMDKQTEETLLKIADYNNAERDFFTKRIFYAFVAGIIGMVIYMIIDILGLSEIQPYTTIVEIALGFNFGILLTGALYSSRYITKIKAMKMRLLKRNQ